MKLDLSKILSIVSIVGPLVKGVQREFKGAKGIEKHAVVVEAIKKMVPVVEDVAGKDLVDNAKLDALFDQLIVAEKTSLTAIAAVDAARANLNAFIASLKGR